MNVRQAYEILLRLYPRDYRTRFATEMSIAFEEASVERRKHGRAVFARFAMAELTGLAAGAAMEWIAKLTTDESIRGRSLPDRLLMRPPGVPWDDFYSAPFLPEEVSQAQERTDLLVNCMMNSISRHDFKEARLYSYEEHEARASLRALRKKHQIED
jgi:hypothetical protein